jgi:hypothetical protein
MTTLLRICLLALALLCLAPLYAEGITVADLIAGKAVPLVITAKAFGPGWVRLRVGSRPGVDELTRAYGNMLGAPPASLYYSKGEKLVVEGEAFLVAYRQPLPDDHLEPLPLPLTPASTLSLSLLRLSTLSSLLEIAPYPV